MIHSLQLQQLGGVSGRSCTDICCSKCCSVIAIEDFNKRVHTRCDHLSECNKCNQYEQRPETCSTFKCLWLESETFPIELDPVATDCLISRRSVETDRYGIIQSVNVFEGEPDAFSNIADEMRRAWWTTPMALILHKCPRKNRTRQGGFSVMIHTGEGGEWVAVTTTKAGPFSTISLAPIITHETYERFGCDLSMLRRHCRDFTKQNKQVFQALLKGGGA